jgi:hypothetical protein
VGTGWSALPLPPVMMGFGPAATAAAADSRCLANHIGAKFTGHLALDLQL